MPGNEKLRPGIGRTRAALYILSAAALSLMAAIWAYEYYSVMKEKSALRSGELVIWTDLVDRAGELEELVARKKEELQMLEEGLLVGRTPSLGAAHLQSAFREYSSRSGIKIDSGRALKDVDRGRYIGVPVEFRFRAGVSELKELLSDIRGSRVAMGVRSISIKSSGERAPGRLDVMLVVEGLMRKAGAS